jgi:hypothetical protein
MDNQNIAAFVRKLLANPPGAPHSIQLEVDVDGDIAGLFEVLLMIMTAMLKSWYEPPIRLTRIREEDMTRLVRYFASFGMLIDVKTEDVPLVLRINNKAYETKSQLEDMTYQMTADDMLVTVRFGFLRY